MVAYIFSDLLNKAPSSLRNNVDDAREWMSDNVTSVTTNRILRGDRERLKSNIEIGKMYMFLYDPKTKEKLPYYDRFPLLIPFGADSNGFIGLNLHYISPLARAKLMDGLWPYIDDESRNKKSKLDITYNMLKRAAKLNAYKPCVKKYLNNHVKSRFVNIYPEEWNIALFLPTERFVKAGKERVYRESARKF